MFDKLSDCMITYLKRAKHLPQRDVRRISKTARETLEKVRKEEARVRHYSRLLDHWDPPSFRVTEEEIKHAGRTLTESMRDDIDFCQ